MDCPVCGVENPEGKKHCGECAEELNITPYHGELVTLEFNLTDTEVWRSEEVKK